MNFKRKESRENERFYIFEMKDSSMDPEIKEGDEIQVDTLLEIMNGDFVVAVIEDGRTILRKMNKQKDGEYIFTPLNAKYEPIFSKTPVIIGRAVRLYRKFAYEPFKREEESNIDGFVTLPELDSEREGRSLTASPFLIQKRYKVTTKTAKKRVAK